MIGYILGLYRDIMENEMETMAGNISGLYRGV